MRVFETGAVRSDVVGKPDYEGYLSPRVIEAFGRYMLKHQKCEDGSLRHSDNWQSGIPKSEYLKSAWRHFWDWWALHRGVKLRGSATIEDAICALLFNAMGYLHEYLKAQTSPSARDPMDAFRCAICGFHLANDRKQGCVPGDCSMRPRPAHLFDPERAKMENPTLT